MLLSSELKSGPVTDMFRTLPPVEVHLTLNVLFPLGVISIEATTELTVVGLKVYTNNVSDAMRVHVVCYIANRERLPPPHYTYWDGGLEVLLGCPCLEEFCK